MDVYRVSRRGRRSKRSAKRGKRSVRRRTKRRTSKRVSRRDRRVSRRRNVKRVSRRNVKRVSRRRNTRRVNRRQTKRRVNRSRRNRRVMRGGTFFYETSPKLFYMDKLGDRGLPVRIDCPEAGTTREGKRICWNRDRDENCPNCDEVLAEAPTEQSAAIALPPTIVDPASVTAAEDAYDGQMRAQAQMRAQMRAQPTSVEPEPELALPPVVHPTGRMKRAVKKVVNMERVVSIWKSGTLEELQEHINSMDEEEIDQILGNPFLTVAAAVKFLPHRPPDKHLLSDNTKGLIVKLKAISKSSHSCSVANLIQRFEKMNVVNVGDQVKGVIRKIAVAPSHATEIYNEIMMFYEGDTDKVKFLNFLTEEIQD